MVSTLEEVALHQNSIEKIELLGQVCPHLKILYLQNNLISKIQNLNKLKVHASGWPAWHVTEGQRAGMAACPAGNVTASPCKP